MLPKSSDGVQRFPRLPEGKNIHSAPKIWKHGKPYFGGIRKYEKRVAEGDIPKGYDHLTKRQKKICRLIGSGYGIKEACKKIGMGRETFFRLRRAHPLFRTYLNKQIMRNLEDVDARLERQVLRASQVVDETLDNDDTYFAADMAKSVLKGRGRWKNSTTSVVDQKISGKVGLEGQLQVSDNGLSKELMETLVKGLLGLSNGGARVDEMKTITVQQGQKDGPRKALPPKSEAEGSASTGSTGS
jgi:hypothetical protein